jgi:hypothetical protein
VEERIGREKERAGPHLGESLECGIDLLDAARVQDGDVLLDRLRRLLDLAQLSRGVQKGRV